MELASLFYVRATTHILWRMQPYHCPFLRRHRCVTITQEYYLPTNFRLLTQAVSQSTILVYQVSLSLGSEALSQRMRRSKALLQGSRKVRIWGISLGIGLGQCRSPIFSFFSLSLFETAKLFLITVKIRKKKNIILVGMGIISFHYRPLRQNQDFSVTLPNRKEKDTMKFLWYNKSK